MLSARKTHLMALIKARSKPLKLENHSEGDREVNNEEINVIDDYLNISPKNGVSAQIYLISFAFNVADRIIESKLRTYKEVINYDELEM